MRLILVVDDNPLWRSALGAVLESVGMRVITASDGIEGVATARSHRPDLIVMDLQMPRLDGWCAVSLLRGDTRTADIPILVSSSENVLPGEAQAAGFTAVLPKGASMQTILSSVRRYAGH